jgi:serine/threonine-protein kinase RsbW
VPCSHRTLRAERRDAFCLPALGSSVAEARRRLQARLLEWGVDDELNDDAGLVLSELFTNAVRYTRSGDVACQYEVDADGLVRIEVADEGGAESEPLPRVAAADEEGGRGLLLVTALSRAWGVRVAQDDHGRVVWAELGVAGVRRRE